MGALLFISTQLGAAEERPFLPGLGHEPGFFTRGHAREYRGWLARWDFRQTPDEEVRQDAGVEAPWTDKARVRRANRINGPGVSGVAVRGQAEGRYALARLAHSGLALEQPAGLRFSFESDPGLQRRRDDAPSDRE